MFPQTDQVETVALLERTSNLHSSQIAREETAPS